MNETTLSKVDKISEKFGVVYAGMGPDPRYFKDNLLFCGFLFYTMALTILIIIYTYLYVIEYLLLDITLIYPLSDTPYIITHNAYMSVEQDA